MTIWFVILVALIPQDWFLSDTIRGLSDGDFSIWRIVFAVFMIASVNYIRLKKIERMLEEQKEKKEI